MSLPVQRVQHATKCLLLPGGITEPSPGIVFSVSPRKNFPRVNMLCKPGVSLDCSGTGKMVVLITLFSYTEPTASEKSIEFVNSVFRASPSALWDQFPHLSNNRFESSKAQPFSLLLCTPPLAASLLVPPIKTKSSVIISTLCIISTFWVLSTCRARCKEHFICASP